MRQFENAGQPETDAGVAAYLSGLYEQGRSAACASMVVAALRFRARLHGRPSPVGAAATRVLAGFRRLAAERGRGKVAGVGWEQADRTAAMAEQPGDLSGLRDAAIVAVASDALLRVSELAALDVPDVDLTEQTVLIRHSKTDQEGKGVVQFLGQPTMERIQAWLRASDLADGALVPGGQQIRPGAGRAPDGQKHPADHHPAGQGRRRGWPGQRPQPARRQRAEPGHRRGFPGRDAGRRTLAVASHAGALRTGTTGQAGSGGEAAVRVMKAAAAVRGNAPSDRL